MFIVNFKVDVIRLYIVSMNSNCIWIFYMFKDINLKSKISYFDIFLKLIRIKYINKNVFILYCFYIKFGKFCFLFYEDYN